MTTLTRAHGGFTPVDVEHVDVLVDAQHPWPGLIAYSEQDSAFFCGRKKQIEELDRLVRRERLTTLYGKSGLGKSSLIQAGLFPRLREELYLPVYIRLSHSDDSPPLREQILARIRESVERENQAAATRGSDAAQIDAPRVVPGETLWEHFHRQDTGYWTGDNRPLIPVLVFDQFEEAFTLGAEGQRKERTDDFLDELGDLIEGRTPQSIEDQVRTGERDSSMYAFRRHPYKIVIGIRADFLDRLEKLEGGVRIGTRAPRSIPSLRLNRMALEALSGRAALEVTSVGGEQLVPPDVGERIVRLVAGPGEQRPLEELTIDPAILSLFCRELNERRLELGRSAITSDLVEGERDRILAKFYEESFAGLAPKVRSFVENKLITASNYRDSIAEETATEVEGVSPDDIEALLRRRLLRREVRDGLARIELSHDVLIPVVRQHRDERKQEAERRSAEERASAERAERDRAREQQARAEAEAQQERRRAAEFDRQARDARRFARIAAVLGILAIGIGTVAVVAERDARAQAREAGAQASIATREKNRAAGAERARHVADSVRLADASRMTAQLTAKADTLTNTIGQLNLAQTNLRQREIEVGVESEAADQYVRMAAAVHQWRDSVFAETQRQAATLTAAQSAVDSVRHEARLAGVRDGMQQRDSVARQEVARILCGWSPPQGGDAVADRLRRQFVSAGLLEQSACTSGARLSSSARSP